MTTITPGRIYRAQPAARSAALILIHAINQAENNISVTLLSPDINLGTSDDLLLTTADTGLPYPLLAQADILGYLAPGALWHHMGTVPPQVLTALQALRNDDAVDHQVAGPPLVDGTDPRWAHKLAELRRLQALSAKA